MLGAHLATTSKSGNKMGYWQVSATYLRTTTRGQRTVVQGKWKHARYPEWIHAQQGGHIKAIKTNGVDESDVMDEKSLASKGSVAVEDPHAVYDVDM